MPYCISSHLALHLTLLGAFCLMMYCLGKPASKAATFQARGGIWDDSEYRGADSVVSSQIAGGDGNPVIAAS